MRLTFLGAAGEVTGSCYLVETGRTRFLIDCGMFQGGRFAEQRNFAGFAFDPAALDFVLLSHAHIDHSGLLPRLVALGFNGPVYATRATVDLLGVMLPDSAHLQEKEAERDNRGRAARKQRPPLYTVRQAQASLRQLRALEYDVELRPHSSVRCVFRDAGHILGSAILEIWLKAGRRETKLVFSGDLGQPGHPIVNDPAPVESADVLLVESTYGDRVHKNLAQTLDEFAYALTDTLRSRTGNVVIPAFAVGRTQDILYFVGMLHRQGRLPPLEIFVDSPMAVAATRITLAHPELFDRDAAELAGWLTRGTGGPRVHFVERVEDSMRINAIRSGAVIISASGMCDGGRIRHHLKHNLPRPECAVVFAGFQASGTLGRRIVDGAKSVRIHGETFPVRAKVFTIGGLSAHADQAALLGWLSGFRRAPRQCWVAHGEPLASHALRDAIRARSGWRADVPARGQSTELAG